MLQLAADLPLPRNAMAWPNHISATQMTVSDHPKRHILATSHISSDCQACRWTKSLPRFLHLCPTHPCTALPWALRTSRCRTHSPMTLMGLSCRKTLPQQEGAPWSQPQFPWHPQVAIPRKASQLGPQQPHCLLYPALLARPWKRSRFGEKGAYLAQREMRRLKAPCTSTGLCSPLYPH